MTTQRSDTTPFITRALPVLRAPLLAAAPGASSALGVAPARTDDSAVAQQRQETQRQAAQLEAQRQAVQLEAQRQAAQLEAQRQQALVEAQRQQALVEAQRQQALAEAARAEAARQEAVRQEFARQAAARQEAARQELARQQAAQQEAARREAERTAQALRQEAESQEAVRQAAARQAAARADLAQQDEARREASRRAMGRQLDEEAAKRDAAAAAGPTSTGGLPPAASTLRRGRLFGRTDANAEMVLYAEAWARKIQLNATTMDLVREAAKKPHTQPVVTVSIRSDGSVESVVLVRSSGVAEIDEAVQRIVRSQAPYAVFAPALAGEFDVIEIRRTWHFDSAIRLY